MNKPQAITTDYPHSPEMSHHPSHQSILLVSLFEYLKGILACVVAAMIWQWHDSLADFDAHLDQRLNSTAVRQLVAPALDKLSGLEAWMTTHWRLLCIIILIYAVLHFVEATGLLWEKTWAYWMSLLGYGIFIPIEILSLLRAFSWISAGILIANILVVWTVYRRMRYKGLI